MTLPARLTAAEVLTRLSDRALDGTWLLDSARSTITFRTRTSWGLSTIKGSFTDLIGEAAVVARTVTARLAIPSASIDTRNVHRDKQLRSVAVLDVERHPYLTFVLGSITPSQESLRVHGTLSVRQVTRALTFDVGLTQLSGSALRLNGTVDVDRSEYGIDWNQMGMVSMKLELTIAVVFTRL